MRTRINHAIGNWNAAGKASDWYNSSYDGFSGNLRWSAAGNADWWGFGFQEAQYQFLKLTGMVGTRNTFWQAKPPKYYFTNLSGKVDGNNKVDWLKKLNFGFEGIRVTGAYNDVDAGLYDGSIEFIDSGYSSGGRIDVTVNGYMKSLYGGFSQYTSLPGQN